MSELTYKRCVRDLNWIFNQMQEFTSPHILIMGSVSMNEILGNRGLDFFDDYCRMLQFTKTMCRHLPIYHKVQMNKQFISTHPNIIDFVDFFCTSTSDNKLGIQNHRYKSARNADIKCALKYRQKTHLKHVLRNEQHMVN